MRKADAELLFDYLFWLRDRILSAATQLSPEEFTSSDTVWSRDLRATLVHELDVEFSWRERLRGEPVTTWGPDASPKPEDYPTLDALVDHWRRDQAEMRSWLAALTDEDLATKPPGENEPFPLWFYVMHLLSHAIQQCTVAGVLLTRAGQSPGDLEFLDFASSLDREQFAAD
jgi:uncharacterized damage-inducible protein DinB